MSPVQPREARATLQHGTNKIQLLPLNLRALEGQGEHSPLFGYVWTRVLGGKFAFSYCSPKSQSSQHLLSTYCVRDTLPAVPVHGREQVR